MLDAMESNAKGNNNFGNRVILQKEARRKNQTYFFSKLLAD